MIATGKKDVIISYVSYFLRMTSNIFLLPVILKRMPTVEYGLWNVFVSIGALVNLIDIGFSTVIVRYITYAFCGAKNISETGMPEISDGEEPNYELLFKIFFAGKQVYRRLFKISLWMVTGIGIYIFFISKDIGYVKGLFSWGIYGISICIYIYYTSFNCVIKGLGKSKESYVFYIIQQVIYLMLATVFLYFNFGILALALAHFIATSVFRIMNGRFVYSIFNKKLELFQKVKTEKLEDIYTIIKNNTAGIAVVTISNYILNYGGTLLCSFFLTLEQIASLGLTNQLIGMISSLAMLPFSVYLPKLSDLQLNGKKEELKNYYACVSTFLEVVYLAAGMVLVLFGNRILILYGSNILLLSKALVITMLFSSFVLNRHQSCTNFIMLGNEQPHTKAYFISSVITLLAATIGIWLTKDVKGYIVPVLLIQLSYNAWKWPVELNRRIKMKKFERWVRSYRLLKNEIMKLKIIR